MELFLLKTAEEKSRLVGGVRKKLKKDLEEKNANGHKKEVSKTVEEVEPAKLSRRLVHVHIYDGFHQQPAKVSHYLPTKL